MAKLDVDEISKDIVDRITIEIDAEAIANIIVRKSMPGILRKLHIETGVVCKNCKNWVYGDSGPVCISKVIMPVYNFTKNDDGYCSYFEWGEK